MILAGGTLRILFWRPSMTNLLQGIKILKKVWTKKNTYEGGDYEAVADAPLSKTT